MSNYNDHLPRWSTKRIVWTIIAVFVGAILLSWAAFAVSVATSGPKGIGDGIKQKNSASNWIAAQKEFHNRYEEIIALDKDLTGHRAALDADPDNKILQTNVMGVTSRCNGAVADYNADSASYLMEEFKSAELPYRIDESDPATDCK
jgi:hypothetical protein